MSSKKRKAKSQKVVEEEKDITRSFIDPQALSPHLFCSICQDVFMDPQRAPCGHSFCKPCISAWLKCNKTCPEDRKHLTMQDLHHDFILENIIGDQKVACPFRSYGCSHVAALSVLVTHMKSCSLNPEYMPDFIKNEIKTNISTECNNENEEPIHSSLKLRLFKAGGTTREVLLKALNTSEKTNDEVNKRLLRLASYINE